MREHFSDRLFTASGEDDASVSSPETGFAEKSFALLLPPRLRRAAFFRSVWFLSRSCSRLASVCQDGVTRFCCELEITLYGGYSQEEYAEDFRRVLRLLTKDAVLDFRVSLDLLLSRTRCGLVG